MGKKNHVQVSRRFAYGNSRGRQAFHERGAVLLAQRCYDDNPVYYNQDGKYRNDRRDQEDFTQQESFGNKLQEILEGFEGRIRDRHQYKEDTRSDVAFLSGDARGKSRPNEQGNDKRYNFVSQNSHHEDNCFGSSPMANLTLEGPGSLEVGVSESHEMNLTAGNQSTAKLRLRSRRPPFLKSNKTISNPSISQHNHSTQASPSQKSPIAVGGITVDEDLLLIANSASKRSGQKACNRSRVPGPRSHLKTQKELGRTQYNFMDSQLNMTQAKGNALPMESLLKGVSPSYLTRSAKPAKRKVEDLDLGTTPLAHKSRLGLNTTPYTIKGANFSEEIEVDCVEKCLHGSDAGAGKHLAKDPASSDFFSSGNTVFNEGLFEDTKIKFSCKHEIQPGEKELFHKMLGDLRNSPHGSALPYNRRHRPSNTHASLYTRMQHVKAIEKDAMEHSFSHNDSSCLQVKVLERCNDLGVLQTRCTVEHADEKNLPREVIALLPLRICQSIDVYAGKTLKIGHPWRLIDNPMQNVTLPLLLCSGAIQNV